MSPSSREILQHITDECEYLTQQAANATKDSFLENETLNSFLENETLKRAIVRSIEVIGEAAKQVPDDRRESRPDIDWRRVCGMRDRLIHGYFAVDYEIVWDVLTNHIPALRSAVQEMMNEDSSS